ncbi:hypothetical protein GE061_003970 [Apolygus lucorum]|uniref:WSC domain-containing protein n=1 Tax=Apolygus lucorum TaxID=248454 RepID=A0A8S9WZN3_APOLU|nr:hypothetical protein GE061_003970 [Apolygus lucorum]
MKINYKVGLDSGRSSGFYYGEVFLMVTKLRTCLLLLGTIICGWSKSVERHARDLKILTKSALNETHAIHKENVHELTISGDTLELQALIRAIENPGIATNQLNYLGCYKEIDGRLMKGSMEVFQRSLTPEKCMSDCRTKDMRYFGLQYGHECFCSMERPSSKQIGDFDECNMKCSGNPRETCGGVGRISVYDSNKPEINHRNYLGCFKEVEGRLMKGAMLNYERSLTRERCMSECRARGMRYFGLQYRHECFCSNDRPSFELIADIMECDMKCSGNPGETCGGYGRLSVYDSKPDHRNYLGCFKDLEGGSRLMQGAMKKFERTLTLEICLSECRSKGFRYFGLQYNHECFCSAERPPSERTADFSECNMRCAGNPGEMCGGVGRISVYDSRS